MHNIPHTEESKMKMRISRSNLNFHPRSEFKKGHVSWLKGTKGLVTAWNKGTAKVFNCLDCKSVIKDKRSKRCRSCSQKGHNRKIILRGREVYNFKGLTPLYTLIRKCFQYRQWRDDVYTRDNFTCLDCGIRGGKLHAHHIKYFSDIVRDNNILNIENAINCDELWNINNGKTLCCDCHKKFHKMKSGE